MLNKLKEYLLSAEVMYNGLNNALKAMSAVGILFFIFLVWQQFVSSLFFSSKVYSQKISILKTETAALSKFVGQIKKQKPVDVVGRLTSEKTALEKQLKEIEEEQQKYHASLVTEKEMFQLIQKVVTEVPGIELHDLKHLTKEKMITISDGTLFQNPIEMTLTGTFNGVYNYLSKIEAVDINLHWDELIYKVKSYPEAIVTLDYHIITIQGKEPDATKNEADKNETTK